MGEKLCPGRENSVIDLQEVVETPIGRMAVEQARRRRHREIDVRSDEADGGLGESPEPLGKLLLCALRE